MLTALPGLGTWGMRRGLHAGDAGEERLRLAGMLPRPVTEKSTPTYFLLL